jgi:subtilase family serine protease
MIDSLIAFLLPANLTLSDHLISNSPSDHFDLTTTRKAVNHIDLAHSAYFSFSSSANANISSSSLAC